MSNMEMKTEDPSKKYDDLPERDDSKQTETVERAIVRALEAGSRKFWEGSLHARPRNPVVNVLTFLASIWVILFAILSLLAVVVGSVGFGISPFHSLKSIAYEQAQNERETAFTDTKNSLAEYHVELGNSLLNVGEITEAKAEFDEAIGLDEGNANARLGALKSELFTELESQEYDPTPMQQRLSRLDEEFPNDTHIQTLKGHLFSFYQQEAAVESFKAASDLDPSNAAALTGLAFVYQDQGKLDEYLEVSEKAHDVATWSPGYQYNYAEALALKERDDEALSVVEDLISWEPKYLWSYNAAAGLYRLTGDLERAAEAQRAFIEMLDDEEITSLRMNEGGFAFRAGGPETRAVILYEEPEKRYYAYYNMALTSYLRGDVEEAKQYIGRAKDIQIKPDWLEPEVRKLIAYDLENLKEKQSDLGPKIDEFGRRFV